MGQRSPYSLTIDDYGMCFSVASLSARGTALNPSQRREAPLYFCHFPGLIEETHLVALPDGHIDSAYVINCYIHILPANQRRSAIIKRFYDDSLKHQGARGENQGSPTSTSGPPAKKANSQNRPKNQGTQTNNYPAEEGQSSPQETRVQRLERENRELKKNLAHPPLPQAKAPVWVPSHFNKNKDLPKDL